MHRQACSQYTDVFCIERVARWRQGGTGGPLPPPALFATAWHGMASGALAGRPARSSTSCRGADSGSRRHKVRSFSPPTSILRLRPSTTPGTVHHRINQDGTELNTNPTAPMPLFIVLVTFILTSGQPAPAGFRPITISALAALATPLPRAALPQGHGHPALRSPASPARPISPTAAHVRPCESIAHPRA
jgi:hypothetical protein